MQYTTLGRTGLAVSVLGYGGAPLGLSYYLSTDEVSDPLTRRRFAAAVERALDLGVTYFDTAPGYGDGASERLLGEVLAPRRDRVVVASKCPYRGPAEDIAESVEASLERLRTDCIDVMQFHGGWYSEQDADRILAPGGPLEGLERLREAGKIRFLGATAEVPSGALERLIGTGRLDVLQVCYNLVSQLSCDHSRPCRGVVAMAKRHGMGVASMRTTTSGFLQRLLAQEFPDVATPERVTRMAVKFVLSTPEIDVALVGMRSPAEVEANAALASDAADRYAIDALHDRYADRP